MFRIPKLDGTNKFLLEIFVDFAFFICISPFRVIKDEAHPNGFRIFKWLPQTVLAALVALIDIFGCITRIRINVETNLDNPVKHFNFMWSVAVTLMHVAFYKVLWTKQNEILMAVKTFNKSFQNCSKYTRMPWHSVSFIWSVCGLSLILGILPSLKGSYLIPHPSPLYNWNPSLAFKAHVTHSKFMFFLSNTSESGVNSSYIFNEDSTLKKEGFGDLTVEEIILGVGHSLVYTIRYLGVYCIDLFMFVLAAALWLAVKQFVQEVPMMKDEEPGPAQQHQPEREFSSSLPLNACRSVVGESLSLELENSLESNNSPESNYALFLYEELKSLNDAINKAMGPILFCYVFEAIFYYATNLNSIFTANDWHARIQVTHFLLSCSTILGLSADITRKMDQFRLWLVNGNMTKRIGPEKLVALIHETQSKAVGISAYDIFTVDYNLIFNIVTTTVTFFLIVIQFSPSAC